MWSRDLIQSGSRIALLLVQFVVLIFCVGYIEYIYTTNILPDKRAKETFIQTSCFLIGKKLNSHGHFLPTYRADFLVSYPVNGVQYSRWVSGNGLDYSFSHGKSAQEDILLQYQVGGNYPCYYNPSDPELAILVLRYNWLSMFPLIIPSIVLVILIYYLLKNLLFLLGNARIKTREIIEERKNHKRIK